MLINYVNKLFIKKLSIFKFQICYKRMEMEEKEDDYHQDDDKNPEAIDNNIINPIGLINYSYENYGFFSNYSKMKTANICYMNSSIQCFLHLKDFTNNITKTSEKKNGHLLTAVAKLIEAMKKIDKRQSDELSVKEIKEAMGKIDKRYNGYNQEDANEFISNFLDGLLDEIGDKNNLPEPLYIKDESDKKAYLKFYNRFYKAKGNSFLLNNFLFNIKKRKSM